MIGITCPSCNAINKKMSLSQLLVEKGESSYPFIYLKDCCDNKKVKYILSENNGIQAEMVDA